MRYKYPGNVFKELDLVSHWIMMVHPNVFLILILIGFNTVNSSIFEELLESDQQLKVLNPDYQMKTCLEKVRSIWFATEKTIQIIGDAVNLNFYTTFINVDTPLEKIPKIIFTSNLLKTLSTLKLKNIFKVLFVSSDKLPENITQTIWELSLYQTLFLIDGVIHFPSYNCRNDYEIKNVSCPDFSEKYLPKIDPKGCKFKVTLLDKIFPPPYIYYTGTEIKGLVVMPLKVVSDHLNLKLDIIKVDVETQVKSFLEKISYYPNYIEENQLDSYIVSPNLAFDIQSYDATHIFSFEKFLWIAPKPRKLADSKVLSEFFSVKFVTPMIVTFLSVLLLVVLGELYFRPRHHWTFEASRWILECLRASLATGTKIWPKTVCLRMFMVLYTVYSMHTSCFIQGELSSKLTNPGFEKNIKTISGLVNSDLTVLCYHTDRDGLLELNLSLATKLWAKSRVLPLTSNKEARFVDLVNFRNTSTTILESLLAVIPGLEQEVNNLGNSFLLPMTMSYVLRKGHPLLEDMNKVLRIVVESGFDKKWKTEYRGTRIKNRDHSKNLVVLSFDHIHAGFYILGCGLSLSFVVFIAELIFRKFKK